MDCTLSKTPSLNKKRKTKPTKPNKTFYQFIDKNMKKYLFALHDECNHDL